MNLNIVIPVTPGSDAQKTDECKRIAESLWNEKLDINVITEQADSYQTALNKAMGKLKDGYVLFAFPWIKPNSAVLGSKEFAQALLGDSGLLVFGYKKISWNIPELREGEAGTKETGAYLQDFHGSLADEYYTSVVNKIFSVEKIHELGLNFDDTVTEYFELDLILRYLAGCKDVSFFAQPLVTFNSRAGADLTFDQRFSDKLKILDSYEKALTEKCGKTAAKAILDEERLNYAIYEAGRIGELPPGERKEVKNKLNEWLLSGLGTKDKLKYMVKSCKERLLSLAHRSLGKKAVLDKEAQKKRDIRREDKKKTRCVRIRNRKRALMRHLKKKVLLYCESTTMKSHIFDYYECIRGMEGTDIYIYYPGNWDDTVLEGMKPVRTEREALSTPWDLVVSADAVAPLYYTKEEAGVLYINHGLHMISYDGGESLYAYSRAQDAFTAMFEPNKSYAGILGGALNGVKIVHTGYKNAEKLLKKKEERMLQRS